MNTAKRCWQFVANDRSPNNDIVRGTATVLNAADLRAALAVAAVDVVIRSTR